MKRRALSSIIALVLCLDLCPVWVSAAGGGTGAGPCPHHPVHTDECGYVPPSPEQECTHEHDDGCYAMETNCIHEHTAECYPAPDDGLEEAGPDLCAHVCSEDSGCVTRTLSCPHEHDEACGYVPEDPGAPCTFVCRICPVEDLIGKLPASLSADNSEEVQAHLSEIYALCDGLTGDELEQIDLSPCAALLDQLDGLEAEVQSEPEAGTQSEPEERSQSTGDFDMSGDWSQADGYVADTPWKIYTNGHTLTVTASDSAVKVTGTGSLELKGTGTIKATKGTGVVVEEGGSLTVAEGVTIQGRPYAIHAARGADVTLSGGTYIASSQVFQVDDGDYAGLLAQGSAFFDTNGNVLSPNQVAGQQSIAIRQCTDHQKTYTHGSGTPTHTWTCVNCGTTGTEKCTFNFVQDGDGTSTCADCGNKLAIVVDESDLSGLVYDGTVKPEEVGVTVTLTGPDGDSTTLVRDTDFEVNIEKITNAGQAKVTVTGKTFNGTFVKTYTVEQATPGISWSGTSRSVNYDGNAVTAGELPSINITINTPSGEDLHPYLRYAYKKTGDADFTDGLPTNAGIYQVKAYLEESQNYTAAETDPLLTLTINKIDAVVTAPQATTPTYDRTAQELVTRGTLDPVAVADGLEIQFATNASGPFSPAIPTGTDAGDYTVWYKVVGLTDNYTAPDPNPAEVTGVKILRKAITPVVELSQYKYLYDGGWKEPTVTVKDEDHVTVLLNTEYQVEYQNNRNVSTDANPAKAIVTDSDPNGGNYDLARVEVPFQITQKTQDTLSITQKPDTVTYGDQFTLSTTGGSDSGNVTWKITSDTGVATIGANSGQITIIGDGTATVKATKSGGNNYEDAIATWEFTAVKKPVTATVTADDKPYDGSATATVHAVVESGILAGDEIVITGLTGTFSDENAGADKTVTVVTTGATITGNNSQHYAVSYSSTTVKATIHKAVAQITTAPGAATPTYNGTAQALIGTAAVVDPNTVQVEYALSEAGPYDTAYPKGTDAGTYTVWYRVQETNNYTGLAPASVDVTIAKKPVSPTIALDQDSFVYDGTAKKPVVTLYEADGTTVIPTGEYTVAYSGNINVGTATVTVTAKADGNYTFDNAPVTKTFTITEEQARVVTAPEPVGRPLFFTNYDQQLVTAGTAEGGTMVYRVGDTGDFEPGIPERTNAGIYKVYYKVKGDSNHSDSAEGSVEVTIAPKTVNDPTIELKNDDSTPFVSCTYDGSAKEPKVVVKDGSDIIGVGEYEIVYSDNKDAGRATVSITDKPGGNYTVTGHTTFEILKADIVFSPAPIAATLTYDGTAQELLVPGTTSGGTVYYALGTSTSEYHDYIPTGVNAGAYKVYYKVTGDKNHKDFPIKEVPVTIGRKPLTVPTIELTPNSFEYDGAVHLPAVTVKDGDTVLPASEYTWVCDNNAPTQGGTYTITVTDTGDGNYDLSGAATANKNTATFTIGKAVQAELVIDGKPATTNYGDSFQLTASGGSSTGAVSWNVVSGPATVDASGNVTINDVGEVTISAVKAGDTNYEPASAQWTFTAAPKPVTASVTVQNRDYDGTTAAAVDTASITTINSDTVTIDPDSITAAFEDPHAGTDKTVTLDASNVQVTGDTAKYAISYPDTVTANITQATTKIDTAPAAIAPLTYSGQPQALVTAGQTNVGFLVYSLSENGEYSREIPTGTDAGTYTVYYKVDGTSDYTGVAVNTTPISVTIAPKPITPTVELSQSSYLYDGTKKEPKITVKDGGTVLDADQYNFSWNNDLTSAGTHTVTISEVSGKNYTFTDVTATVEIKPAEQAALHITGQPTHIYYGDTIATLGTTGGTSQGTVKWSITAGGSSAEIDADTGVLTITGTGSVTVKAERTVPNYGTVSDTWTFTVEPKPVTAEVTVAAKTYDGNATATVTASVKASDLVNGDTVTLSGLKGAYADPNAGTGKPVTLDSTNATKMDGDGKYTISYPATAKGDITQKAVTVTITLSDHDLKTDNTATPPVYYYEYDGTEKKPTVIVTADDGAALKSSDYEVGYANNKNVSTATVKAAVTVTAKAGGNYTFTDAEVKFAIRSAAAVLVSSPLPKDLTYEKGTEQELVTVGTATGGTVVYSLSQIDPDNENTYSETIPKGENAGTYTVYYMVKGDSNHADTTPQQMNATIKPKQITPTITLSPTSYEYDGTAHKPAVTVKDGTETIDASEYSVSYRDNINAGTATVTVSNENGGNYIVNGTATFEITKAAPTVTAPPTEKTGLYYNGELQDLVTAGVTSEGTVVYSVNGGNYVPNIPTAFAVDTYNISWKVLGDDNHRDTAPATLTVTIAKNTVTTPTITLSQDQFTYDGDQHRPTVTVYDNNSRLIPEHEYTVSITGTNGNVGMVNVDTYAVTIAAAANSNYEFTGTLTRTFEIVAADQETISITGTKAQVRYGDEIQLGVSGGTGSGTVKWEITGATDTTLTQGGLLTVKDVNTSITVTVTRSRDNYSDVSATWEFTAAKKPVTAEVTVAAKDYDGNTSVASTAITATVKAADLAFTGDSITITGLTGTYDNANVGTGKTVTLTGGTVGGTSADKYDVTIPATATGSILGVAATVATEPTANTLTYDASRSQELVTAGTATGGTMVYSLDGTNFTPNIPKGKDAGNYKVYYKAQGDQNHTDSAVKTKDVTIAQQTVTPQIELSPPSGQYDGKVQQPAVTVRDAANNVIPTSEYTVVYDPATNWKDVGKHKVKVQNVTGGNYIITETAAEFEISTSAQAPLEIVNKPGLVYYGDTFTLSATGGSSSSAVTWNSSNTSIADIDTNGFVTIKGTGSATITATKAGGGNYDEATATYPLNALKKPATATFTADDREYRENDVTATIHVTWSGLVGNDTIDVSGLTGAFEDANVGANKKVTITGNYVDDATAQKYDITFHRTTTASITKATATAPAVTAKPNLIYTGSAQALVTGGDTNTLYSTSRDGVYSAGVPTGTNAGTYTIWYKEQGDANHSDSEPQSCTATIDPKTLTLAAADIVLSGSDLKTDTSVTPNVYYYEYDGTDKTPSVVIKDGAAAISASEYTVTYSDNRNVTTDDKKATVTIADNEGGNYIVSGSTTFEIRAGSAELTSSPQVKDLTYTGTALELVTVGTATGGHLEYKLTSVPAGELASSSDFSRSIPKGTNAGTYTVEYKVVGDNNHTDGPTGSVTVTIQPKTVVSPKITVTGTYTYDGTEQKPTGTAVTVEDGGKTIPDTEYTLSYQNNTNAGTATVIVIDNNGGNYTVNGTATFEIGKAAASVGTAPTGKTSLHYNGSAQELLGTKGTATGGTLVYSLDEDGEYSAATPTGKAVGEYEIWYKVLGDGNHSDSAATKLADKVKIEKNAVTDPTIQVTPPTVKYTGERQEPNITVKDDNGLLINGSEYTVTYKDAANNNTDLTAVGTYTVTITGVTNGNYTFNTTKTATFTITPADQTALIITGTRERVYYGDTIQLGTTGGGSGGTVTWTVDNRSVASITNGLLKITGTGSVTVTATSSKTGYADQTATWQLHAERKPVTAVVTAAAKDYDGSANADVTATLQGSDFVGTDSFTITLNGCTFEDANAGTDKKVNVVSSNPTFTVNAGGTDNHENYAITYLATATASIFKADIAAADVTAPTLVTTGLTYTGLPQALIATAGSATGGTMEYSLDGETYSTGLPTGTDAGSYDVWYRVKGDGNHKDTAGTKLAPQVTIAPQEVTDPIIEFTPSEVSYDGAVHKPSVTVKDANGRVIPETEYTVAYSSTDWKTASSANVKHEVTVTDSAGGNYTITNKTVEFKILPVGQSPLSITNQPGRVQYGDSFTLSTSGGSGTGIISWGITSNGVATIDQNGLVKVLKSGGATVTATKQADGNYGAVTVSWTFNAEKKPVTAIVTARNKPYDSNTTATLDVSWKPGDLLSGDSITLSLTGAFDDANVGENKTVRITLNGDLPDGGGKYAVTYNDTTTASITAQVATVSGVDSSQLTYDGTAQSLLRGGAATNGTIVYSRNGVDFMETSPTERDAGRYTVYYKARGNTNYADSDVRMVEVTIQPKTVTSPAIELSSDSVAYDGNPKEPDVVSVKDGSDVIPASEYTVRYSNNISVGTATVTITDVPGGNYTVSGSKTFTITAGAVSITTPPQPKDLEYNGFDQALVTPGTAVNGSVVYSTSQTGTYTSTIPTGKNAAFYQVWYKAKGDGGETAPESMIVEIKPRPVTAILTLSSTSLTYTGSALTPAVTVSANGQTLDTSTYQTVYSNNTEPGTATVTVTSIGGNYQFTAQTTFTIAKAKATFLVEPEGKTDLYYIGEPQELVSKGTANNGGIVLYSLDNVAYSTAIPTGTERGSYTVFAKVQGSETYAESDIVIVDVEIAKNVVTDSPDYDLSATSFPYTGSEVQPTVTLWDDDGYEIDSSEYTLRYSNNIAVGTATIKVTCKRNGNYSFNQFSITFQIVDASQTPLAITGKPEGTAYYGDTLSLGTTGGGSGTVTWSSSDPNIADIGQTTGVVSIKKSGSVTITATKGSSTDAWTFVAKPKPVTATVYAADKVFNGTNAATLTVTLSGLLPGDTVSLTATGSFIDEKAGTDKTVLITGLNGLDGIKDKYTVTYNNTTTASITPVAAGVTTAPTLAGSLTYNGGEQPLLASGGSADGGNLMYSLDGRDYSYTIPTGTDAKTYTVWYKVEASDDNHKDSSPVKLGDVTISADPNTPQVRCDPNSFPYDGTEKTPTVVVLDSTGQHIIPESEYTVEFPANAIATGSYTVTVKDRAGGNYQFSDVTGSFEIVASSQAPVSITDKPANVHYGDTFYLSATGGSGDGAVKWSIAENTIATINDSGAVTVNGTGSFTVKAYREASGGYTQSNTDSVTFVAQPKPVTPVVTASDKSYNGNTDAALTASVRTSDLVNSTDNVTLSVSGVFASADAGVGKRVDLKNPSVTGTDEAKYTINWPDYVTATINRVDAKIVTAPSAMSGLREDGNAHQLVSAGTTENNIGTIVYSLSQYGTYSTAIPSGTAAGDYTVWYQVADSVNYNGVAPASILVRIERGTDSSSSDSGSSDSSYSAGVTENSGTNGAGDAQTTYSAPAAVQDGTANTVLRASEGASMVRQAAANKSQSIVIKPEIAGEVTKSQVSIPSSTVSRIQSETDAALTVSAPIADVTIPNAALDTLSSAGGTVDVATEQVGDAVKLTLTAGGEAVEEVPGGVTLSVPAEDAGPGTVAVLVHEDGTRETIQKSVAKDGVVNVPLNGSATVEIVDNSKEFEDVPAENWAADAVAFASAHELFNGTSETTFSPDEDMSRGMLATVLYNLEGRPEQDLTMQDLTDGFSDVSSDAWYADGVAWAAENGITSGYGGGQFGPDDSITREQFAVMLWKYAGSPAASGQELSAADADQVSGYAQEALRWAVENKIMSGYADGRLAPGETTTRAQAAQMLKNFMENA